MAWPTRSNACWTATGRRGAESTPAAALAVTSARRDPDYTAAVTTVSARPLNLGRADGSDLFTAAEAVLKGSLESEVPVHSLVAPRRGPLVGLFELVADERTRAILTQHALVVTPCADGARAVSLAMDAARSRRRAIAVVSNEDLDSTMPALERAARFAPSDEGGMCVILEDDPAVSPAGCPRLAMRRLDVPCLEPADVAGLRDSVEHAQRLSRAAERLVGVVVHHSILRTIDTLPVRPNRVVSVLEVAEAMKHPRRGPRPGEALDLLRMARRLELNQPEWMPSPGELAPLGVVAIGPARVAMRHVLAELRLTGRVPLLHLGLVHPIDEAVVERLLARCADVVVLEPRPGAIGELLAASAERLRRRGLAAGRLWWDALPPDGEAPSEHLGVDDALKASTLARRMLHLLHDVRPGLRVASRLASLDLATDAVVPPRAAAQDSTRVFGDLRDLLREVDLWARRLDVDAMPPGPTALAVDGIEPLDAPARVVAVECWDRQRFAREGVAAIRQAARDSRQRLIAVVDLGGEDEPDPERLTRAATPGERGEAVRIESGSLGDRVGLRDLLREAVRRDGLSVVVVRLAGPGADPADDPVEIDRLGYQPVQRIVWSADLAGDVRPALPRSSTERSAMKALPVSTRQVRVEPTPASLSTLRVRLRPLLEQTEVVRTRPPTVGRRFDVNARLTPPRPEQGQRGSWRAHCAGVRGRGPGVVAEVLCDAGRLMGFHVRCIHDPTPIGLGRRAWSQMLFTRPRLDEPPPPLTPQIPYGEADLLIGVDALETLRAIGPDPELRVAAQDRTTTVANSGMLEDQLDGGLEAIFAGVPAALARAGMPQRLLAMDVAALCRDEFLTDRVVDLVLLGMAFQRGQVPATVESMESAVRRAEQRGIGRALESFQFGRHLAERERLGAQGAGEAFARVDAVEPPDSIEHLVRRIGLDLRSQRWPRVRDVGEFLALVRDTLERTAGLAATAAGRAVQVDIVLALRRCLAWGGLSHARQYARLVWSTYDLDRSDRRTNPTGANSETTALAPGAERTSAFGDLGGATQLGHELTRLAVLPLADAMLPRDLLYLAMMATSNDHRRRMRQRLGVRQARGDRVERRYLNRLDLTGFGWRVRVDFRTSDWPARATSVLRPFIPQAWRGTRTERAVRDYVVDLAMRAASGAASDPQRWLAVFRRLNAIAAENRLRTASVEQLRTRVEGGAPERDEGTRGERDDGMKGPRD